MNAILRNLRAPALLGMVLLIGACQNMGMMPTQQKSLYDRLGGKDAIVAVVDDFVGNVAADNRINRYFAKTDIPRLKRNLVDQICAGTGGPCTYTGRDMKTAHAGMGVTNADFDALVGDLVKTLDKFKVPDKEKVWFCAPSAPSPPRPWKNKTERRAPRATRRGGEKGPKTRQKTPFTPPLRLKKRVSSPFFG